MLNHSDATELTESDPCSNKLPAAFSIFENYCKHSNYAKMTRNAIPRRMRAMIELNILFYLMPWQRVCVIVCVGVCSYTL